MSLFLFHHFIFLFVYYLVFHSSHSFICKVRSLLILSSYHFPTHFHLHVDLPQLYHTLPEPALDTSLKYPYHLSLYLFTPSSLSPLLSIYVSLFFLFFFCHHHSFSLSCDFFLFPCHFLFPPFFHLCPASTNERCHGQIDTGWSVCSQR